MELVPVRLLADVFESFAPMTREEALRRAELATETLAATRSRSDQLQLGLALRSLDLAPMNALAGGGLHRFSRSAPAARERVLLAWSSSRIPQRRTAFQAWKRLALFLAYADPGPDPAHPANAAWDRIGYRPPEPPPQIVEPFRPVPIAEVRDADVVIVGSGAGGGVVASRLAGAGLDVVVLEAGGAGQPPTLEAEAWRDRYLDRGTTATADLSVTILAGSTLGGGTTVNWTTMFAPPDDLRAEWESEHGLTGFAGPEADADLRRLVGELDLQPPTVVPAKDRVILDGARALGWDADVTRRNAGPCTDCGGCGFGCARGAKRSAATVHLAAAAAAGARVVADALVTRIVVRDGIVRGVTGRSADGAQFAVRTPRVVVAAGALRTPVLLSASDLASHREVGGNLRIHPTVAVIGVMAEAVEMWRGPLQAASCGQFRTAGPATVDGIGPAHGGFLMESAPPHPGLAAAAISWHGISDATELMDRARHWAPLIAIIRERGAGRVRRDAGGHAVIDYRLHPADAATARRALVEMSRLAHAAGAVELRTGSVPPARWRKGQPLEPFLRGAAAVSTASNRISLFSAHQMGTVRAGADPHRYPADPWGRLRLDASGAVVPGVYIGDGSLLPAAPGVNPMLTIMVMAERSARAVLADAGVGDA